MAPPGEGGEFISRVNKCCFQQKIIRHTNREMWPIQRKYLPAKDWMAHLPAKDFRTVMLNMSQEDSVWTKWKYLPRVRES